MYIVYYSTIYLSWYWKRFKMLKCYNYTIIKFIYVVCFVFVFLTTGVFRLFSFLKNIRLLESFIFSNLILYCIGNVIGISWQMMWVTSSRLAKYSRGTGMVGCGKYLTDLQKLVLFWHYWDYKNYTRSSQNPAGTTWSSNVDKQRKCGHISRVILQGGSAYNFSCYSRKGNEI